MKFPYRFVALLLSSTVFAIAQQSTPTQTPPAELPDSPVSHAPPVVEPTGLTVVLDTSMGRMTCRFFDKQAPLTVANFIGLAEGTKAWTDPVSKKNMKAKPFYDGTTFHRVIPNFMIQGGDPTGTGTGDPGYMFADEFDPDLNFDVPGRMAMANSGPGTNGSQFFITGVPTPWLNRKHTIFGEVIDGTEVIDEISKVETGRNDRPVKDVVLESVVIEREGNPPASAG
jgi:peptidyl-prolyl cis-trans isomerase A (cyclophilin A)